MVGARKAPLPRGLKPLFELLQARWWLVLLLSVASIAALLAPRLQPTTVSFTNAGIKSTISVEGEARVVQWPTPLQSVQYASATHGDWVLDGSPGSLYGRLNAALYGLRGRGMVESVTLNGLTQSPTALSGGISLGRDSMLRLDLLHVEAPASFRLLCAHGIGARMIIDRTGRAVTVTLDDGRVLASWYYPTAVLPHLVPILGQVGLAVWWALLLAAITIVLAGILERTPLWVSRLRLGRLQQLQASLLLMEAAAIAAFAGTAWVTIVEYGGLPHITDGTFYLQQARLFASGHLSAQPPPIDLKIGFAGVVHGRWLIQYAPGTAATLVPGLLLGIPWLPGVTMTAGTVWLIGAIARRLYGSAAGVVAAWLAAFSPFMLFMGGTYLSHVPSAFFGTLALYFLVGGEWGSSSRSAVLAGVSIGAMFLCREFTAALYGVVLLGTLAGGALRQTLWSPTPWRLWHAWRAPLLYVAGTLPGLGLYLAYDLLTTGSPLLSPRAALFPTDRPGFGPGHGWWGMHTLAAGLVNLEQQVAGLSVETTGWPIGAIWGAMLLPFVFGPRGRSERVLVALLLAVLAGTVAYFYNGYNGVVYGPRYVYEAVPPLLILTAGGLTRLAAGTKSILRRLGATGKGTLCAVTVLAALLATPNLFVSLPRHMAMYKGYGALGATPMSNLTAMAPPHAVIAGPSWFTDSAMALNNPIDVSSQAKSAGTIWLPAPSAADIQRLRHAYPHRALYVLRLDWTGVYFHRIS